MKKSKKILLLLIMIMCAGYVQAQDVIIKKNGEEIKSKVLEVTPTEVKYKSIDNLNGPSYTLLKSEISVIKYQNGTKDVMATATDKSSNSKPKDSPLLNDDKGYVGFSLGLCMPVGSYGSTDLSKSDAGFAETGLAINLSLGYKLGKTAGLSVMINRQANAVDEQTMASGARQAYPTLIWSAKSDPWVSTSYLLGGYFSFPLAPDNKIDFDVRVAIGIMSAEYPAQELDATDPYSLNYAYASVASASATAFASVIGLGFKFNVGPKVCVLSNLDYLSSSPEFTSSTTVSSASGTQTSPSSTYKYTVSTINLLVGVGYRL